MNYSKICGDIRSSRCTTSVINTGDKWKISSIIKVLIILFGHLWEVELTYRYIFAFKLTFGLSSLILYLPPVSTTLAKLVTKFAAGVVYTDGKFASGVVDTGGAP